MTSWKAWSRSSAVRRISTRLQVVRVRASLTTDGDLLFPHTHRALDAGRGKLLPEFHRGGFMIQADKTDLHPLYFLKGRKGVIPLHQEVDPQERKNQDQEKNDG